MLSLFQAFRVCFRSSFLLWCVWTRQFKRVIHLFREFKILCNEMLCLDREIKKHLKYMHFFEVFQLAKLEEIQIHSKKVEFKILLT